MSSKIKTPSAITQAVTQVLTGQVTKGPLKKSNKIFISDDVKEEERGLTQDNMMKSILKLIGNPEDKSDRIAFTADPNQSHAFHAVFKDKVYLVPDRLLKKIAIRDELVASIVTTRANQISSFGRPRPTRFEKGFILETRREALEKLNAEPDEAKKRKQKEDLQSRKDIATRRILMCGESKGWFDEDRLPFSQYLIESTKNAITVGRLATEIIYSYDKGNGKKKFHSFRVIDAGTIYRATNQQNAAASVRKQAKVLLEQVNGNRKKLPEVYRQINSESFAKDEYAWIQVIEDQPRQAFKADECLVHNFYPVADVELDGYPVTPIDMAISAVLTHLSISTHNRLYFQNGRASRGMLVVTSDDMDQRQLGAIRQQFNASINSVEKSFRMPVFSMGVGDSITWQPIDISARDGEFQLLSDMNSKTIFAAFQMSPEEIPAWAGLAKGSASQALSDSNNEYKLEVARDAGLRPLLSQFEDFMNNALMPLIDPMLAEMCVFKFVGLDSETAEKESVRTQQDMPIHMTYDEVLERVEKRPIGKSLGGEFPLNPAFQTVLDKYYTVGEIQEKLLGKAGAASIREMAYYRDPFWFQQQARLDAEKQQQQQQAMQQQAMQQQAGAGGDESQDDDSSDGSGKGSQDGQQNPTLERQKAQANPHPNQLKGKDGIDVKQVTDNLGKDPSQVNPDFTLNRSLDEGISLLKSETQLNDKQKKILVYQDKLVEQCLEGWEQDAKVAIQEIKDLASRFSSKKKK